MFILFFGGKITVWRRSGTAKKTPKKAMESPQRSKLKEDKFNCPFSESGNMFSAGMIPTNPDAKLENDDYVELPPANGIVAVATAVVCKRTFSRGPKLAKMPDGCVPRDLK